MSRRCLVVEAGLLHYQSGLALQNQSRRLVEQGLWDGVLILLEHYPVITVGTGGNDTNILQERQVLDAAGVELMHCSRGGDVTCHNPGQLVVYPVMNLAVWQKDVHWYVEQLEEIIIQVLGRYQLRSGRKARYTGVWLNQQKVAAIGIAVKRWISSHGFALNINNDLTLFNWIIPCGIKDFGVTNLVESGIQLTISEVLPMIVAEFSAIFGCSVFKSDFLMVGDACAGAGLSASRMADSPVAWRLDDRKC